MTTFTFYLGLLAIAAILFTLGMGAGIVLYRHRQRRDPLSVDGLAERADVNGSALVGIARQIDLAVAGTPHSLHGAEMQGWSQAIKRIAVEHLECINAISLDALAQVRRGPVHLGELTITTAASPPCQSFARRINFTAPRDQRAYGWSRRDA